MDPVALALTSILISLGISYLQTSPIYRDEHRIWGEWFAWASLAAASKLYVYQQQRNWDQDVEKETHQSSEWRKTSLERPAWILASTLVATQLITFHAVIQTLQWSFPLTTLVVFLARFALHRNTNNNDIESSPSNGASPLSYIYHGKICRLDQTSGTFIFIALCLGSSIILARQATATPLEAIFMGPPSIVLIAAAYLYMARLSARTDQQHHDHLHHSLHFSELMGMLALRACALFTLYLAICSVPIPSLQSLGLAFSTLRAVLLFTILRLCYENTPMAPPALLTVSTAILDGITTNNFTSFILFFMTATAALVQVSSILPKSSISRIWLFLVLLLPVLPSLHSATMTSPSPSASMRLGNIHPIQSLVHDANARFSQMENRQSNTLQQAVVEYKRRYGRLPPPGFERWFEIAKEKEIPFIDEFDTITETLEPFWGLAPSALRSRFQSLTHAGELTKFHLQNGKIDVSGDHWHADYLKQWVNYTTWGDILPDIDFMISTLDEPRVVAPYDTVDRAMQNAKVQKQRFAKAGGTGLNSFYKSHGKGNEVEFISIGQQDAWEGMVSSCRIDSPARSEGPEREPEHTFGGLHFVQNTTESLDVCASSDRLRGHGFFDAPASLMITHSLVPVFSQCKPSIFNDILYPSPYYQMQIESNDYVEDDDTEFNEKLDRLYWAGAATGGWSKLANWKSLHRQRITLMTADSSTRSVSLLERGLNAIWQIRHATWGDVAQFFYLRITALPQCDGEACDAMKKHFDSTPEPKEAALNNKYVLDMDGNTFSGRYYRLLKSNAAVFKHTVFKEWHDGRLIPWVHYIPVSPGAEELGEIMRFLVEEEEGRMIGRNIASQGRDWARKSLRKEDLEVAFVRVLLEYARVMNDNRDTMGFDIKG